jgi:TonB family protein
LISTVALIGAAGMAFGQQSAQTVKDLYAAAAYEEALAAVAGLPAQPEVEQYRVFSLTALGRKDEAQKVMESLIQADPLYTLNPAETPPRVQEAFESVRQRMLPGVTRQLYLDARAALERKERGSAVAQFERLLKIIDAAGPAADSIGDLRILAAGFLDLSKALPVETPVSAPAVATTASQQQQPSRSTNGASPTPAASAPAERVSAALSETRPIPIKQDMPSWVPNDAITRRTTYTGLVRVRVGADGRVEDAEIVRPSYPLYDVALLRAARTWMYEPAKRNGTPVASEVNVEVNLKPPQ